MTSFDPDRSQITDRVKAVVDAVSAAEIARAGETRRRWRRSCPQSMSWLSVSLDASLVGSPSRIVIVASVCQSAAVAMVMISLMVDADCRDGKGESGKGFTACMHASPCAFELQSVKMKSECSATAATAARVCGALRLSIYHRTKKLKIKN